jgi:hypothetical protein
MLIMASHSDDHSAFQYHKLLPRSSIALEEPTPAKFHVHFVNGVSFLVDVSMAWLLLQPNGQEAAHLIWTILACQRKYFFRKLSTQFTGASLITETA